MSGLWLNVVQKLFAALVQGGSTGPFLTRLVAENGPTAGDSRRRGGGAPPRPTENATAAVNEPPPMGFALARSPSSSFAVTEVRAVHASDPLAPSHVAVQSANATLRACARSRVCVLWAFLHLRA